MKKELQQELIAIAQRITQVAEDREVPVDLLKEQARQVYEKLTILDFTQQGLAALQFQEKESIPKQEDQGKLDTVSLPATKAGASPAGKDDISSEHDTPDGTEFNDQEAITEPNTEKIKDIVAQMPPESDQIDQMLNNIFPKIEKEENPWRKNQSTEEKISLEDEGKAKEQEFGVHFDRLPLFEPVDVKQKSSERPKSVNDRLKTAIHIGLNDRHAFVKHLFGGSTTDYNRVLSQLNTHKSKEEALGFIENMVKPDYNNWEGKELYENRFLNIIDNRFA